METARGGILLRGIGTLHNDVAVVTNVSADHLHLQGIRTLDQLAEVKAAITHITRREGWDVLNADDPRVLSMRRGARGRPWLFSLDPDHPALRSALDEGGRGTDHVVISELFEYLRGRDRQDLVDRLRAGAIDGGSKEVPVFDDEIEALERMLVASREGDVVGVTALGKRAEIFGWLHDRGASRTRPERVRELVRRSRGG